MSVQIETKRRTTRDIQALKRRGEKIAMLTAYDHVTAQLLDEAGIDILLVGDSLGNVVLGYETTLPVTLADMIRHAGAVQRGSARALVVCDLPFGSATDPETALVAPLRYCRRPAARRSRSKVALWRRRSWPDWWSRALR